MDGENQLGVPLAARYGHTVTWTGNEVAVWGGNEPAYDTNGPAFNDGAAFDPSTSSWRTMAPAPVASTSDHLAVWTGEEVLFLGGQQDPRQVVAYNPVDDVWSTGADSPFDVTLLNSDAVWAGERVLTWTGTEGMATYDPRADRWEKVDEPPLSPQASVSLHVDQRTDPATVVAVGGQAAVGGQKDFLGIDVATREAAGNWRQGPRLDQFLSVDGTYVDFPRPHLTALTDAGLLAISSGVPMIPAALWNLDGDWMELPPPKTSCEDIPRPVAITDGVVIGNYCGDGALFDTDTLTFTPFIPAGRMGFNEAAWTGQELIAVTASCCAENDSTMASWRMTMEEISSGGNPVVVAEERPEAVWHDVAQAPLTRRDGAVAEWTGEEFFIWGGWDGQQPVNDGATYDPTDDTWRPIPEAPIPGAQAARSLRPRPRTSRQRWRAAAPNCPIVSRSHRP